MGGRAADHAIGAHAVHRCAHPGAAENFELTHARRQTHGHDATPHRAEEKSREAADLADRVLSTLSTDDRLVLMLVDADEMPIKDVAIRAEGYGMPGVVVDGSDVLACYRVAKEAVDRARRGEGGTLIEAKVIRLTARPWEIRTHCSVMKANLVRSQAKPSTN